MTLTRPLPFALAALALVVACNTEPTTTEKLGIGPPDTVGELDLNRYLGLWYEIGSFPQPFQEGCEGTTAEYATRENDELIDVLNRCYVDGELIEANGLARPVDLTEAKLEVSFFQPFWGDYWVLELGEEDGDKEDFVYAVVGAPSRDSLWILNREPAMDDDVKEGILERLEDQAFDTDRLEYTDQSEPADGE